MPVSIKRHSDKNRLILIQGGELSGQKMAQLISENDDKLNLQQLKLDEIELAIKEQPVGFEDELMMESLLGSILKEENLIVQRNLIKIASQIDWTKCKRLDLVKQVSELLTNLTQNAH